MKAPKISLRKWLKIIGYSLLAIVVLFISVVLLIRTEWAQSKITGYATGYYVDKAGTPLQIEKLYLTFSGDLLLKGLYVEDQHKDTLLYSKELQAGISFKSLIDGQIHLSAIDWNTLVARVNRNDKGRFNFDYIIEAFASNEAETPDTSQGPLPEISLAPIRFYNFDLHYLDSSIGMNARLQLGQLTLKTDSVNLDQMHFSLGELLIENTRVSAKEFSVALAQTESSKTTDSEDSTTTDPVIDWQKISLKNVALKYLSAGNSLNSMAQIGDFSSENAMIDLGKQKIDMQHLHLNRSDVAVKIKDTELRDDNNKNETPSEPEKFTWPDWNVSISEIAFSENQIRYDLGEDNPQSELFDADHITLHDLGFKLNDILIKKQLFALSVQNMVFSERSGIRLKQLVSDLSFSDTKVMAQNTRIETNNNSIATNVSLSYQHIDSFLADPMKYTKIQTVIKPSQLSIKDAFYFDDSLQHDSIIMLLANETMRLSGEINGYINALNFKQFQLKALGQTTINLDGELKGLPEIEKLQFDIPNFELQSNAADIGFLAPPEGFAYPKNVNVKSKLKGSLKELLANVDLKTTDGNAIINGNFYNLIENPSAKGKLIARLINAAKYTKEPDLEPVSLNLQYNAAGNNLNSLVLQSKIEFVQLIYNKIDYSDLKIDADLKDKQAVLAIEHHKPYLDFSLASTALIDEKNSKAKLDLNVKLADLTAMNLDTSQLKMAFDLNANFAGNAEKFSTDLKINNGEIKHHGNAFVVQPLSANMSTDQERTKFNIASGFLSGKLEANESITMLIESLEHYLAEAISTNAAKTPLANDQHLQMTANFEMHESPLLSEMLTPGLTNMDTVKLSIDFKPAQDLLKLYVVAPNTVYNEMQLEQFELVVDATNIGIESKLSFKELNADPVEIHSTEFNFSLIDSLGQTSFVIYDELDKEVIYMAADIRSKDESYSVHFEPNHFVLNSEPWEINPNNLMQVGNATHFSDFIINRNKQQVSLQTDDKSESLLINFNDFDLAAVTSILNAEENLASGELSGRVKIDALNSVPAATANIQLKNLALTEVELGNMGLALSNKGYDHYDLSLQLSGDNINTQIEGNYSIKDSVESLMAEIDFARINMHLLAAFAPEYVSETSGFMHGKFSITGSPSEPVYNGSMNFVSAKLKPIMLGTPFSIDKQKFTADNSGLYFSNFTMLDANGQKSTLNGEVGLENPINPTFELNFLANNFQFLNSKKSAQEDYFGKGMVDVDAKINGDLNLPKVSANLTLKSGTDITYEIPYTEAQIQEREGIVRFKNMKKSKTTFKDDKAPIADLTGIDLKTIIKVDPKTRFTIIIDPQTGDYLTVQGQANLSFNMRPNGQMDLVGKYEVNDGTYGLNLYDLVSKEFDILPGSSIIWTGDPLDADMDITGEYQVQTSSVDLMANEIDLSNSATVNRYRQKLPFEVKLLIGGKILKPEIAFALDMPNDYKSTLDGTVYNKLQRLNNNESELNLQVFSLIVFNKFLPSNVAAESGNRTSELARSSVSNLLSDQLNQLSSKYIKGVNLDFDLDSYTDYQSGAGQQRTDLNVSLKKNLFDDRLILEVSSQVDLEGDESNSEVLGDVSLEYLLTEDGQLRAKAFRKNEFQDMVEGQVMITGLSILFSKEFDNVNDLKKQRKDKKKEKEKQKKAPKGNAIKEEK